MAIIDLGKIKQTYQSGWSAATTYEKDDVVRYNNGMWVCKKAYTPVSGSDRFAPGYRDMPFGGSLGLPPLEVLTEEHTGTDAEAIGGQSGSSSKAFSSPEHRGRIRRTLIVEVGKDDGSYHPLGTGKGATVAGGVGTTSVFTIEGHKPQHRGPGSQDLSSMLGNSGYPGSTGGIQSSFDVFGPLNDQIRLGRGFTYRFTQNHYTNETHPLHFSTTEDGTHASGAAYTEGVKYFLEGKESTKAEYEDSFTSAAKWRNFGSHYIEWTVDEAAPDTMYYYCHAHSGMGAKLNIQETNRGWIHWDTIGNDMSWKGKWNDTTQYYWRDLVEWEGGLYSATVDNKYNEPATYREGERNATLTVPSKSDTLDSVLTSSATTLLLATSNWPTSGILKVDEEYISWTGRTANSGALTGLTRAVINPHTRIKTTAAAHVSGASVELYENPLDGTAGITMDKGRRKSQTSIRRGQSNRFKGEMVGDKPIGRAHMADRGIGVYCWEKIGPGRGPSSKVACAVMNNEGPMDWPFSHNMGEHQDRYRNRVMITKNGKVMTMGPGTNNAYHGLPGYSTSSTWGHYRHPSYLQELCFTHEEWWLSQEHRSTHRQTHEGRKEVGNQPWNNTPDGEYPKAIQLEVGYDWVHCLFNDGSVWGWGHGGQGQLGTGDTHSTGSSMGPHRVQGFEHVRIIKISASFQRPQSNHFIGALDDEGQVWTWGRADWGQLGTGNTDTRHAPHMISQSYFDDKKVVDICMWGDDTGSFSAARTQNDDIYAWGANGNGFCGQDNTTNYYYPVKVPWEVPGGTTRDYNHTWQSHGGIKKWTCAGSYNRAWMMVLDGKGYLWHVGYNNNGQAFSNNTTGNDNGWRRSEPGSHNGTGESISTTIGTNLNGRIADFWTFNVHDHSSTNYASTYVRLDDGTTWYAGAGGAHYRHGYGDTASHTSPVRISKMMNLRKVMTCSQYSDISWTMWLTDTGELYYQGYGTLWATPNPNAGSTTNWTGEDGDQKPYHCYIPCGSKVVDFRMDGQHDSTSWYGPNGVSAVTEDGRYFVWGWSGHSSQVSNQITGHQPFAFSDNNIGGETNGQMFQPGIGR